MSVTDGPRPWTWRRRAAIAIGAFALAGLAFLAGTGWDTGVVTDWFDGDDAVVRGDWANGVAVAADTDADAGVVAAVEVASALGGDGECVRVRLGDQVVDVRCVDGPLTPWEDPDFEIVRLDDYVGWIGEHAVRTETGWRVALAGAVHPDVTRVTVHFGDGSEYSFVTRNQGGWFAAVLPADVADPNVVDGSLVNPPTRAELFDAEGTRLATVDLPAAPSS